MKQFFAVLLSLLLLVSPAWGDSVTPPGQIGQVLGPLIVFGDNPWIYADEAHEALADHFLALYGVDPEWDDTWNTALVGTISVTNGSTTVTGTSTTFQTTFCSGGTSGDGSQIVIWYPRPVSGYGRRDYLVVSCTSQTVLTLDRVYDTSNGTSGGLSYARWTDASYNTWMGGGTNPNYYDNVIAHYMLYYRTNNTTYRDAARTLAAMWWSLPDIDEGYANLGNHGFHGPPPRVRALTGIMLWAVETGNTGVWTGVERILDGYIEDIENQGEYIYDIREAGYRIAFLAVAGLIDPDSGRRAKWIAALEDTIDTAWTPLQRANGQWDYHVGCYIPLNGYPGTATVTNGSATVTGSSTTWQASWLTNNAVLFYAAGDYDSPDPVSYTATWVSSTEITLDRPYEGSSGSGKGWNFCNLVGVGTQPFMMGIIGTAWYWAFLALDAAESASAPLASQFVLDAVDWIKDYGYSATAKGLYYGRDFPNCEPISDANQWCGAADVAGARFLNGEVMGAVGAAYILSSYNATYKTFGDALYAAMFAYYVGDSGYDGISVHGEIEWALAVDKAKDHGFLFGMGFGAGWPAVRLLDEGGGGEGTVGGGSATMGGSVITN
jgi:hypothetical protein